MRLACACLVLALAGCYTDAVRPVTPPPPPVVEDQRAAPDRTFRRVESPDACADVTSFECMLVAFSRFRDEACDCSAGDKVCGEAVMADMNRWSQDLAAQLANKNQVPTPEQGREMSDVASEFSRCLMKAITPVNVPPPPPAP